VGGQGQTESVDNPSLHLDFHFEDSPAVENDCIEPKYNTVHLKEGTRVKPETDGAKEYPEMDFRNVVDNKTIPSTDYVTHSIHKHPAVFIPQIPRHLIETFTDKTNESGDRPLVLDPFNGSGTTGVEAKLLGRNYLGIEINPLSKLVSQVASQPIPPTVIGNIKRAFIDALANTEYDGNYDVDFMGRTQKSHWFQPDASKALTRIRRAIIEYEFKENHLRPSLDQEYEVIENEGTTTNELRDRLQRWLVLMLANTVFDVSNADPDVSKAHKSPKMREAIDSGEHPPDTISTFEEHLDKSHNKLTAFWNHLYNTTIPGGADQEKMATWRRYKSESKENSPTATTDIRLADAREFRCEEYLNSVDLAVTSPPYINAINYYRGTKLRLFWIHDLLEDEFNNVEFRKSIVGTNSTNIPELDRELPATIYEKWQGNEQEYRETSLFTLDEDILAIHSSSLTNSTNRAFVTWNFFAHDMLRALTRTYEHLKPGAHFFLFIGENTIGGRQIASHRHIADIAQNIGRIRGHGGKLEKDEGFDLLGFAWDEIDNRDLFQERNHTNGVIEGEWVVILQKPL